MEKPNLAPQIGSELGQNAADPLEALVTKLREKKKFSTTKYLILSLVLPPFTLALAFYFAWRKQLLFAFLPVASISFSLLSILVTFGQFFTAQVPRALVEMGIINDEIQLGGFLTFYIYLTFALAIFGIISGIYYRRKAGRNLALSKNVQLLLFTNISLQMILIIYILGSIGSIASRAIAPVYPGFD